MARRRWVENDHPRHPGGTDAGGRFRDWVGSSGWAARLASAIGKGSSREVRSLDDEDMRPPWEGGPEDEDDHFLREWQGRLNAIIRERGVEPEVVLPADADELNSYYGQYQADPAELVDYLWEQQMLPGGRGDLDDTSADDLAQGMADGGNFNQEVAQALSPKRVKPLTTQGERDADWIEGFEEGIEWESTFRPNREAELVAHGVLIPTDRAGIFRVGRRRP